MPSPDHDRARLLKVVGGAVLLASFLVQTFLHEDRESEAADLRAAVLERAVIDKSVLLNEVLYFAADSSAGDPQVVAELKRSKINEAARKAAFSFMMPVLFSSSLSKQDKTQLANQVLAGAARVNDHESFRTFVVAANQAYGKYSDELDRNRAALEKKRNSSRWVYLVLSLLGSAVLLVGVWYE
jgi:hypothetical protein